MGAMSSAARHSTAQFTLNSSSSNLPPSKIEIAPKCSASMRRRRLIAKCCNSSSQQPKLASQLPPRGRLHPFGALSQQSPSAPARHAAAFYAAQLRRKRRVCVRSPIRAGRTTHWKAGHRQQWATPAKALLVADNGTGERPRTARTHLSLRLLHH